MEEIIVTIEQGKLKGKIGTDYNGRKYYGFLGIPYAKPPIGELRFKAPLPPEKWSEVRDATKDGSQCYSRDTIFRHTTGSEDCLFLNVFTSELPSDTSDTLKPVMVWIHGGGFTSGSNKSQIYGPEFLLTENVVVVAVNYRLGVLGFLSMDDPELMVSGNAGLKDIVMTLRWVQTNIKEFGGDPNNVTIFGQSAGAAAVHFLLLSEIAEGLFHKAIAQSGCALTPWSMGKRCVNELTEVLDCRYTNEQDILNYLQNLSVEELFEGQEKMLKDHTNIRLGPIIEKSSTYEPTFLNEDPMDIILQGKYNKVPLIMGYNSGEGLFFLRKPEECQIKDFEKFVPHALKLEKGSTSSLHIADKIRKYYFGDEISSLENLEKSCLLFTDTQFARDIYRSIKHHAMSSSSPLYLYRFSVEAQLNLFKKFANISLPGTSHGDELGYLFKTLLTPSLPADSIEVRTIRRLIKLWTNFAKFGNPNSVEDVAWKPVLKDKIHFIDIGEDLTSNINPDEERIQFWNEIEAIAQFQ